MKDYIKIACNNFYNGYNCAQSVLLAFAPSVGLDEKTALMLSSSFGGGMGRLREVCGAVSAMFMIAGLLKGYTSCNDDCTKQKHYELIQELANEFKEKQGSIICRDILGEENTPISSVPSKRTEEYYDTRPCANCIKTAAEIIETRLLK